MSDVRIKILLDDAGTDWSVEIDGKLYQHCSEETVNDLVEFALLAAQLERVGPPVMGPQSATEQASE